MIYGELVYLQSVIVAPLLSFVTNTVVHYSQTVETQAAYSRTRHRRTDGRSLHAGNGIQTLGQRWLKMLAQKL